MYRCFLLITFLSNLLLGLSQEETLFIAVYQNNAELVLQVLSENRNEDETIRLVNARSIDGLTLLHLTRNPVIFDALICYGANPSIEDEQYRTPLLAIFSNIHTPNQQLAMLEQIDSLTNRIISAHRTSPQPGLYMRYLNLISSFYDGLNQVYESLTFDEEVDERIYSLILSLIRQRSHLQSLGPQPETAEQRIHDWMNGIQGTGSPRNPWHPARVGLGPSLAEHFKKLI